MLSEAAGKIALCLVICAFAVRLKRGWKPLLRRCVEWLCGVDSGYLRIAPGRRSYGLLRMTGSGRFPSSRRPRGDVRCGAERVFTQAHARGPVWMRSGQSARVLQRTDANMPVASPCGPGATVLKAVGHAPDLFCPAAAGHRHALSRTSAAARVYLSDYGVHGTPAASS